MAKLCSHCSSTDTKYIKKDMPSPTPVVFLVLGGLFFAMIYGSSQPDVYRCISCKETFRKRSFLSLAMLPFLWLYLLIYGCIVITVVCLICMAIIGSI